MRRRWSRDLKDRAQSSRWITAFDRRKLQEAENVRINRLRTKRFIRFLRQMARANERFLRKFRWKNVYVNEEALKEGLKPMLKD